MNRRMLIGGAAGLALAEIMGARAQGSSLDAIAKASANYGVDYDWLLSTASCETGGTLDPSADNGRGDVGLFQFKPSTFYAYCSGSPWDPYDAADCAAYMFSLGLCTHWCCSGCHPNPCGS